LKLTAGYALFQIHLHTISKSRDLEVAKEMEGTSPYQQFQIRLALNLPHRLEFDTALYRVSSLSSLAVPRYNRLDTRLGWRPPGPFEVSIALQNLIDVRHYEFASGDLVQANQIGRSAYGKVTWRF
jgi:iron complex outermembrane receptor protein